MGFMDILNQFLHGVGSALSHAGLIKETLSSAIADGLESGINRSMPMLMKYAALAGVFFTGIFLFGWGVAVWAESIFATPGLGFILAGLVLVGLGSVYLHRTSGK